jgi:hypothetical protein
MDGGAQARPPLGLVGVHALAVKKLHDTTSPVDKIVLANEHGVREWLKPAYLDLCQAPSLPSKADCERLGFVILSKIARAREAMRFTKLFVPMSDRIRIVQEMIDLDEPRLAARLTAEAKDEKADISDVTDEGSSKPRNTSEPHSDTKLEHPPCPPPATSAPSPTGDPVPSSSRTPTPLDPLLDFGARPASPPSEQAQSVPPHAPKAPSTSWWAESEGPSRSWSPLPVTPPAAAAPLPETAMASVDVGAASNTKTVAFPVVEEEAGPITMNSAQPLDRSFAAGQAGSSNLLVSQSTVVPPVEEPVVMSTPPVVLGGKFNKKKKKGVLHTAALAPALL